MTPKKRIVALGGGGFSMESQNLALDRWILSLVDAECPKVCFLPTASGDAPGYADKFRSAFGRLSCEPSMLSLFRREVDDLRAFLLSQDVIYVGGGNTANMLAIWRAHGIDEILREAWENGVLLAGLSAGSLCWFEEGVTDSLGTELAALSDGLGLLPGSHCPHYDGEADRRPTYTRLIEAGELKPGLAADDGVGLLFEGQELTDIVTSRPGRAAYRVSPGGEEVLEARELSADGPIVPLRGGCHCGAVVWEIDVDPRTETILDCNCSICQAKGFLHLIVAPESFRLLKGKEALKEYRFNTGQAVHRFCTTCGVHSHYIPRSHPDKVDVNVRCIPGLPMDELTIEPFDGKNWEENVDEIQ